MSNVDTNKLDAAITDDMSLDDIESMPKFITLPTGAYVVLFEKGVEDKVVSEGKENAFQAAEAHFTVVSVEEMAAGSLELGEKEPVPGDKGNFMWNRENKYGASQYKEFLTTFREQFFADEKGVTIGMIKEKIVGTTCLLIVSRTYGKTDGKTDPTKRYINIKQLSVL